MSETAAPSASATEEGSPGLSEGLLGRTAAELQDPTSIEATSSTWRNNILWMFYDIADSWWVTTYSTIGFLPYVQLLGARLGWSYGHTSSFSLKFVSASNFLAVPLLLIVSALADVLGNRKTPVIVTSVFVLVSATFNAVGDSIWLACLCYLVGNCFLQLARSTYDSQVPFVCEEKRRAVVQSIGGAVGASGALLVLAWSIIAKAIWGPWVAPEQDYSPAATNSSSSSAAALLPSDSFSSDSVVWRFGGIRWFMIGGGFGYGLIVLPYLFHHERQRRLPGITIKTTTTRMWVEFKTAFKEIALDRNAVLYMLGSTIVADAYFSSQVITTLTIQGGAGISSTDTDFIILAVTGICIVVAFCGGWMMNRWGCKACLLLCIGTQIITDVASTIAGWEVGGIKIPVLYGVFGVVTSGISLGLLTVTLRMFIVILAPPARLAQWNGCMRLVSRILSSLTPSIYAWVLELGLNNGLPFNTAVRFIYFYRILLFLIALVLTALVIDPYRRYQAGERAPYKGIYQTGGALPHGAISLAESETTAAFSTAMDDEDGEGDGSVPKMPSSSAAAAADTAATTTTTATAVV